MIFRAGLIFLIAATTSSTACPKASNAPGDKKSDVPAVLLPPPPNGQVKPPAGAVPEAQGKLDGFLLEVLHAYLANGIPAAREAALRRGVSMNEQGLVAVDVVVTADGKLADLRAAIETAGGSWLTELGSKGYASVPIGQIETLALRADVWSVSASLSVSHPAPAATAAPAE